MSVFLISYILAARSENSCIACTHLSLLYAPVITLHSMRMIYVDIEYLSIRPIHAIVVIPTCDSMKILTSNIVVVIWQVYLISFFIALLARIVNGYSSFSLWNVFSVAVSLDEIKLRLRYSFLKNWFSSQNLFTFLAPCELRIFFFSPFNARIYIYPVLSANIFVNFKQRKQI